MLPQEKIQLYACLGDLKEDLYNNLLLLGALIELLCEKGLISREELTARAAAFDAPPGQP